MTRYTEYTKGVVYGVVDEENYEKYRSTIALLQSNIKRIREANENLQKLYNEVCDQYENCKNKYDKRDILLELEQIKE